MSEEELEAVFTQVEQKHSLPTLEEGSLYQARLWLYICCQERIEWHGKEQYRPDEIVFPSVPTNFLEVLQHEDRVSLLEVLSTLLSLPASIQEYPDAWLRFLEDLKFLMQEKFRNMAPQSAQELERQFSQFPKEHPPISETLKRKLLLIPGKHRDN